LRVGQNSLRGLRPLRSNSRPKSVVDARYRAPRKALCCSARPKGNALRLASHRRKGLALFAAMRSEPSGEEIAAGVRLVLSMALTGRSL
jgi:hypothetical protein